MTVVGFSGLESGSTNEIVLAGIALATSAVKYTGDYSLHVYPTTTNNGSGGLYEWNLAAAWHSFRFRVDTLPAANSEEICQIVSPTTYSIKMSVRITSAGKLQAWNNGVGGFLQMGSDSATTLATDGTWYRIDVYCGNTNPGPYEVRINGVSEISGNGNIRAANCGAFQVGKVNNRNGNTVDFYYDDIVVDDTAYPSNYTVLRLDPAGDGTYTTWTIGAGAGADWQNVDEVPHDSNTTYLLSTLTIGNASTVTLETLASAGYVSGSIQAVLANWYTTRDAGGTAKVRFRFRSGATEVDTGADLSMGASTYYSSTMLLTTDPATSAAWTVAGVNAVEIGVIERNSLAPKSRWTAGYLLVCIAPSAGMGQVI